MNDGEDFLAVAYIIILGTFAIFCSAAVYFIVTDFIHTYLGG